VKGLVLILIAVGLGVAYYSGALNGFMAALTQTISNPAVRRVVAFPGAKRASGGSGGAEVAA
jgi:hypothetical protein